MAKIFTQNRVKPANTAKSAKTKTKIEKPVEFSHMLIMGAMGQGSAGGRLMAFKNNPCEETMNDILDAAREGMNKLLAATKSQDAMDKYIRRMKKAKAERQAAKN